MSILAVSTGSSSLKFALFAADSFDLLARGSVDWMGDSNQAELKLSGKSFADVQQRVTARNYREAVPVARRALIKSQLLEARSASPITSVGHRMVHGGTLFQESVLIDDRVRKAVAELATLAPLHNPRPRRSCRK